MIMFVKGKYQRWAVVALIISVLALLIFFIFTSPSEVGLLGILVVILAIYMLFVSCFYLFTAIFSRTQKQISEHRRLLISSALAFAPVFLIIFNSLGAIGVVEAIMIVLFEAIIIFLIVKRT